METATFAGGCYWCTEAIFQRLKGIISVESGFAGCRIDSPTYEKVSNGDTGCAEVINVTFDPSQISYKDLLKVFFHTHNPTTLNQQGADMGEQYRSAIFYHSPEQKSAAEEAIREVNTEQIYGADAVTKVEAFDKFHKAEDYHQNYYNNNKFKPYCMIVINPKLKKFNEEFKDLLK